MILGFAHPAIVVHDLERAIEFYCQAFGFTVFSTSNEGWQDNSVIDAATGMEQSVAQGCMLAGHNCYLELFYFKHPASIGASPEKLGPAELGIRHLCFYVDDVEAEYRRLLTLGAKPQGTVQKLRGITAVYMRDPEGNIVELAEFPCPEEDLRNLPGITKLQNGESYV